MAARDINAVWLTNVGRRGRATTGPVLVTRFRTKPTHATFVLILFLLPKQKKKTYAYSDKMLLPQRAFILELMPLAFTMPLSPERISIAKSTGRRPRPTRSSGHERDFVDVNTSFFGIFFRIFRVRVRSCFWKAL